METHARANNGTLRFGSFRLDLCDERLWRQQEAIPLSPKAFAVLRYLVNHGGQLLTKDSFFDAVWPETAVSESVLTVAIRELRRALGDQARSPQFIETVHRRGYRFIAPITLSELPRGERQAAEPGFPAYAYSTVFVGRETELAQLHQWLVSVHERKRQLVFIAGEPGIGKTALVDAFVARVISTKDIWVAHGQCIEHYGTGEAYLPVLEAVSRLGQGSSCASLKAALHQYAPSWLTHLPALRSPDDRERFEPAQNKVSQTRMLRELAEALEALTAERPLVLVLEDLHWSDNATLEWLAYIARRRDSARLLVLGTYRPVEVSIQAHPLGRVSTELLHHEQCNEMVLAYLSEAAVGSYLRQRLGIPSVADSLVSALYRHTTGNPLFLTTVVDELCQQGFLTAEPKDRDGPEELDIIAHIIPASLRHMIEQHIEQLSPDEQAILEAASLEGHTFTVAAVAAGVMQPEETIETRCTTWARQARFIQACEPETWPDGTVTARYCFVHALYHDVVCGRVSAGQRVRLHRQIGIRKETGYGTQAAAIAAELASHFTQAQNVHRATVYLQHAASNAIQRVAYAEALSHITKGLVRLQALILGLALHREPRFTR